MAGHDPVHRLRSIPFLELRHLDCPWNCTLNETQLLTAVVRRNIFDVNSKNKEISNSNSFPRFPVITGNVWRYDTMYFNCVMVKRIPEILDNGSWLYLRKKHILFSLFTTTSGEEDSIFHTLTIGSKLNSLASKILNNLCQSLTKICMKDTVLLLQLIILKWNQKNLMANWSSKDY